MASERDEALEVARWAKGIEEVHGCIAGRFHRSEPRRRALEYLKGLISPVERKNGWQLAGRAGDVSPDGVQRLLSTYRWDADLVRDDLRAYVVEHLGETDGVLVVDETGFVKKGAKSVGVQQQYSGTAGRIENCQIGVFLTYATTQGRVLLDRELYLPQVWADDGQRRREAGVPEEVRFRTKPQLAREMLERALERGRLEAGWVAGDDAFGMSPSFRGGLAALGMRYVLDVPPGTTAWPLDPAWTNPAYRGRGQPRKPKLRDGQRRTMAERSDELPDSAWREITVAEGSQGPRSYMFSAQRVRVTRNRKPGEALWAVFRRNLDGSEPRYYLSNAPEDTPLETLACVGGSRWRIESEFETEKSDVGLDEYETRTWPGWHRHIALCLLGGVFLLSLQQD